MPDSDVVPYVYIIYSRHDKAFVSRLTADLQSRGVSVWIDHEDLTPDTSPGKQTISKAIQLAQAVLYAKANRQHRLSPGRDVT